MKSFYSGVFIFLAAALLRGSQATSVTIQGVDVVNSDVISSFLGHILGDVRNVESRDVLPLDDIINGYLRDVTEGMEDATEIYETADVKIDPGTIINATISMEHVIATYLNKIYARDCISDGMFVNLTFVLDDLWIESEKYNLTGVLADTIPMTGSGPMSIKAEDVTINLVGELGPSIQSPFIEFKTITLDLELRRWTVDFKGIMPGTDLGVIFNEFFSMVGPELMDLLENNINKGTAFLEWINNLIHHKK